MAVAGLRHLHISAVTVREGNRAVLRNFVYGEDCMKMKACWLVAVAMALASARCLAGDDTLVLPNGRIIAKTALTGHRGESRSLPENTVLAFKHAVDNGFSFECDFYMSNDGEVFCSHDMRLKRCFGLDRYATNVCWKGELENVDVGARLKGPAFAGRADCRVPRIDDVFALIPEGRVVTLEVKDPRPEIVKLIRAAWNRHPNMKEENVIFLAHKATRAALVKEFPRATYQHCVNCYSDGWKKGCTPVPVEKQLAGIDARPECLNYSTMHDMDLLTREYVDAVHKRGRTFFTWCVDDPAEAIEVFERGVDGICTNCPKELWDGMERILRERVQGRKGASRKGPWPNEKAWAWYKEQPWIRGVNFMPSDCVNRVDQWQEFGFEERFDTMERELALAAETGFNTVRVILEFEVWLYEREGFLKRFDRFLEACDRHGIRAIVVLFNDCAPSKKHFFLKRMGDQLKVYKDMKVRARSPHTGGAEVGYNVLDIPEYAEKVCVMAEELMRLHAHDKRILFWNVMNEPGYNGHGKVAAPLLRRLFEIGWKVNPDQPLAADLFATLGRGKKNPAENVAAELSDIVSYHCYMDYPSQVHRLSYLRRRFGRPLVNTEWMNRITNNRFEECYPLFYLERVGAVNWGLVRSRRHPSSSEPWPSIWIRYGKGERKDYDFTQWMHDIYRPSLRPYDPREIALIKRFNALADEDWKTPIPAQIPH